MGVEAVAVTSRVKWVRGAPKKYALRRGTGHRHEGLRVGKKAYSPTDLEDPRSKRNA